MYESDDVEWDKILDGLYEDEKVKKELQRHLVFSLLYGRQGYGKNFELSRQLRQQASWFGEITGNSNVVGAAKRDDRPTLPQKICNYRKLKVDWYGTETPKYSLRSGSAHFDVSKMFIKGRDPKDGLSVFPPMGSTTGRKEEANPLKGKRFIGVSEVPEVGWDH